MQIRTLLVPLIALSSAVLSPATRATQVPAAPAFDVVIRNGTILDGSGRSRYRADIGIRNGFIMAIGDLGGSDAATEIDARGLYLAPGFINIHSHATEAGLEAAINTLTQGVTTEIVNADGLGPIEIEKQLARFRTRKLALNVGVYVGLNSTWANVVGNTDRHPTAEEIRRMTALISNGLSTGAWGVSAGLDFVPASFARTDEVIDVLKPLSKWRTNFTNHDRLKPETNFSSRAGMAETVEIGTKAGLLPVITHMKVQGHEQGSAYPILQSLMRTDSRGRYVAADAYPYIAGAAPIDMLVVPTWAQEGGRPDMLERFADPVTRRRIVEDIEQAIALRWGGPEGVYFPEERRQLSNVMKEMNVGAGEAVVRMVEKGSPTGILRFGSEADLIRILQHPATSMACDCGAQAVTSGHPRSYGSFPRLFGRYVREQRIMSWEEAVRKSTALPTATIGMIDRGMIAAGMAADIAVFDPDSIIDRATYEEPTLLSEGVRYVIVNGGVALKDGRATGVQTGRVLVRTPDMPSRSMAGGSHRVRVVSTATEARFTLDISQSSADPTAKGRFMLPPTGPDSDFTLRALGRLQTTADWVSFTGVVGSARTPRAVLVTVDLSDSRAPDKARISVLLDGDLAWSRSVPKSRVFIK